MFVLNMRGEVIDTADIPVVRRKGVPPDLRELIDIEDIPFREQLEDSSSLRQLFPRPGGGFLFTHHDDTVLKMEPMPVLTAKVWVGILSPDLSKACVDALVPRDFEIRPMETFRRDPAHFIRGQGGDDAQASAGEESVLEPAPELALGAHADIEALLDQEEGIVEPVLDQR